MVGALVDQSKNPLKSIGKVKVAMVLMMAKTRRWLSFDGVATEFFVFH